MIPLKRIAALLIFCAILCGCQSHSAQSESAFPPQGILLSETADSALASYALGNAEFFCSGDDLICITREADCTRLSRLTGAELKPLLSCTVPADAVVYPGPEEQIVSFSPSSGTLTILNSQLHEQKAVSLPGGLFSLPIPNADGSLIFCTTSSAVMALDSQTGISRLLRSTPSPTLLGVCCQDSVLLCTSPGFDGAPSASFLSAADGSLLLELPAIPAVDSTAQTVFFSYSQPPEDAVVFGSSFDALHQLVLPAGSRFLAFLPAQNAVLSSADTRLQLFSLETGRMLAQYDVEATPQSPSVSSSGLIYFTDSTGTLFRWDPSCSSCGEETAQIIAYFPPGRTDTAGLAACRKEAERIGSSYGLRILIGDEAASVSPWDYSLTPEQRPHLISRELEAIQPTLALFPDGFLSRLDFTLCLVRSISGTSGSLSDAQGIHFRDHGASFIALTVGEDTARNLSHELAHLIDTQVLNTCNAFDDWSALNPESFSYFERLDFHVPASYSSLLSGETRAFTDAYAMSYPVEDRARIFEYALLPDQQSTFDAPFLQEKLRILCVGIRRAFDLTTSPSIYPWEQYLWHSLSYRN